MRQTAMVLDRIDKIDRIAGIDLPSLSNPVNPVNPVINAVRRVSANSAALREIPSGATASLTTKRREPRSRLTAIDCGEPSPRLKPDGLRRRRPATVNPSGRNAVASARTPRVARTRKLGEPFVDGTKTLRVSSRSLDSVSSQGFAQRRRGSSRRSADSATLRLCVRPFVLESVCQNQKKVSHGATEARSSCTILGSEVRRPTSSNFSPCLRHSV